MNERNQDPLDNLIQNAYPCKDADPRLAERLADIAEGHARSPRRQAPRARFGRLPVLVAGILMAVAALAAFQYFFGRTGEAAIALIPADADFVVSLDTNPSETQLAVYQKIGAALRREGLDKDMANMFDSGISDKAFKRLKPYLTLNFAVGIWRPFTGQDKEHSAALVAIQDRAAVTRILREEGKPVPADGVEAYGYGDGQTVFAVLGDYFVAASDAATMSRVAAVKAGREQAISSLPAYREARASLPTDSNLMVFASPRVMSEGTRVLGRGSVPSPKWFSVGAALRDGGIQFEWRSPLDEKTLPHVGMLADLQPIDLGVLRKLPEGAFGLVGFSQLGKAYGMLEATAADKPGDKASFDKGVQEFEKETGLDIEKDIVPALQGDAILAAYPGASGAKDDYDGILLIDTANGASPAALADKVRMFVEKQSRDSKSPIHFTEEQIGDVTLWTLDAQSAHQLQGSAGGDKAPAAIKGKTILYATVQGSVVVTSSKAMLSQTLVAMRGGRSLADDPSFAQMVTEVQPSQFVMMLNVGRIMQRIEPMLQESMGKEEGLSGDDIVHLFGGPNAGLVSSCRVEGDVLKGSFFLPLDYDRVAKVIRRAKDGAGHGGPLDEAAKASPLGLATGTEIRG